MRKEVVESGVREDSLLTPDTPACGTPSRQPRPYTSRKSNTGHLLTAWHSTIKGESLSFALLTPQKVALPPLALPAAKNKERMRPQGPRVAWEQWVLDGGEVEGDGEGQPRPETTPTLRLPSTRYRQIPLSLPPADSGGPVPQGLTLCLSEVR